MVSSELVQRVEASEQVLRSCGSWEAVAALLGREERISYGEAVAALRGQLASQPEVPDDARPLLAAVLDSAQLRVLTGRQVVAANLRRARLLRGWSQAQAAERLTPHLGVEWSRASFSAAERTVDTGKRHFTVDEIIAFARTFALPVLFFLLPPESDGSEALLFSENPGAEHPDHPAAPLTAAELIGVLVGASQDEPVAARLRELLSHLPPKTSDAQHPSPVPNKRVEDALMIARTMADHALVLRDLADLAEWGARVAQGHRRRRPD